MENCCCLNVRKYKEIKGNDKYINLDISLNFESMDKIIITSSESKVKLVRSGKGFITYMGLKAKSSLNKYKKATYAIRNEIKKDILKIIRELQKLHHRNMRRRGPNMSLLTVLLPSKTAFKVYDES